MYWYSKSIVALRASRAVLFNINFGVSPKYSPSERDRNFIITLLSKHRIHRRCSASSSATHCWQPTPNTLSSLFPNSFLCFQPIFITRAMDHCLGTFRALHISVPPVIRRIKVVPLTASTLLKIKVSFILSRIWIDLEENELHMFKHWRSIHGKCSEFCDGNQEVRWYLLTRTHVHSVVIITRKGMTKSGMSRHV